MTRKALAGLLVAVLVAILAVVNASSASAATNRFRATNTYLCLDGYASRNNPGDIYVTGCNAGPFQKWTWYAGDYTGIRSQAESKCIQWTGGQPQLEPCRAISNQYWKVSSGKIQKSGTGYCLTRLGGTNSQVIVVPCNDADLGQRWSIA